MIFFARPFRTPASLNHPRKITIVLITVLTLHTLLLLSRGDASAQTNSSWTDCSGENQQCDFNGTKQISYGANGSYFYGTFTGGVACSNSVFGDPLPGYGKRCAYSDTVTQSSTTISSTWTDCAGENQQCSFNGTKQVSYGANGSYFYRPFTGGVACSNSVFGDPLPGYGKRCAYSDTVTQSSTTTPTTSTQTALSVVTLSSTWTDCAGENQQCSFNGTKQVSYGANGSYFYRPFTGGVACSNSVFGDPLPGYGKRCAYSEITTQSSTSTSTTVSTTTNTSSSSGYTFYVATNGSDSYTCAQTQNQNTPRRTIQGGINCMASGDALLIKGGTYSKPSTLPPSGSSWDRATKIMRFGTDQVTVLGWPSFFGAKFQFIVLDGLSINASNFNEAIMIGDFAHHIRIINSELFNGKHHGVFIDSTSSYNELIAIDIYNNGTVANYDHGIYVEGSNNLIEDCRIYNNAAYGVHLYSGIGATVNYNIVRNNLIFSNDTYGGGAFGVVVSSGTANIFYNNIIRDNPNGGIQIGNSSVNAKIYNNTIFNNRGAGVWVYVGSADADVRNNIISQNGRDITTEVSNSFISNNLTRDPMFKNSATGDFSLQAGSPAINSGTHLSDVPFDFNYVARPKGGAYDIGALEY